MTTTSEKVLQTIKEKHLAPAPRWKCLAKNWVLWVAFVAALVIGALSFSVMLELLLNHDWDVYLYLHKTFLQYVILSLPYIWIVALALFSWLAYYNFVHIKGWYNHHVYGIVFISVASSVCLGIFLYKLGVANSIDQIFSSNIPYYNRFKFDKGDIWNNPQEGLIAGYIVRIVGPNEFVLRDLSGNIWNVNDQNSKKQDPEMNVGEQVKIIGQEGSKSGEFDAKEVRDWDSRMRNRTMGAPPPQANPPQQDDNGGVCTTQSACAGEQ